MMFRRSKPAPDRVISLDAGVIPDSLAFGHFMWHEFFVSSKYPDLAKDLPKMIMPAHKDALYWLTVTLLEPLRLHLDCPVVITSGYRSDELNNLIGGSRNSQHMYGEAVDFIIRDKPLIKAFEWLRDNSRSGLGQLRLRDTFIHVSLPNERLRGQVNDLRSRD